MSGVTPSLRSLCFSTFAVGVFGSESMNRMYVTGISVPLSFQLWKPVAVALMFFGARLRAPADPGGRPRRAGLILVLFAVMPAPALGRLDGLGRRAAQYRSTSSPASCAGQYLWGYLMTAIAVR